MLFFCKIKAGDLEVVIVVVQHKKRSFVSPADCVMLLAALQAATILVAMASEKKIGDWIIGESRHLATKEYKLKRIKLTSRFIAF